MNWANGIITAINSTYVRIASIRFLSIVLPLQRNRCAQLSESLYVRVIKYVHRILRTWHSNSAHLTTRRHIYSSSISRLSPLHAKTRRSISFVFAITLSLDCRESMGLSSLPNGSFSLTHLPAVYSNNSPTVQYQCATLPLHPSLQTKEEKKLCWSWPPANCVFSPSGGNPPGRPGWLSDTRRLQLPALCWIYFFKRAFCTWERLWVFLAYEDKEDEK